MAHDVACSIIKLAQEAHAADMEAQRQVAEGAKAASLDRTLTRLVLHVHKVSEYGNVPHHYSHRHVLQFASDGRGRMHVKRSYEEKLSIPEDRFSVLLGSFVEYATFMHSGCVSTTRCTSCTLHLQRSKLVKSKAGGAGKAAWRDVLTKRVLCPPGSKACDAEAVVAAFQQLLDAAQGIQFADDSA